MRGTEWRQRDASDKLRKMRAARLLCCGVTMQVLTGCRNKIVRWHRLCVCFVAFCLNANGRVQHENSPCQPRPASFKVLSNFGRICPLMHSAIDCTIASCAVRSAMTHVVFHETYFFVHKSMEAARHSKISSLARCFFCCVVIPSLGLKIDYLRNSAFCHEDNLGRIICSLVVIAIIKLDYAYNICIFRGERWRSNTTPGRLPLI